MRPHPPPAYQPLPSYAGAPAVVAPWLTRDGPTASSDLLRANAHCELCRSRSATLRLPSWGGLDVGIAPFPADRLTQRLSAPLAAAGVAQVETEPSPIALNKTARRYIRGGPSL